MWNVFISCQQFHQDAESLSKVPWQHSSGYSCMERWFLRRNLRYRCWPLTAATWLARGIPKLCWQPAHSKLIPTLSQAKLDDSVERPWKQTTIKHVSYWFLQSDWLGGGIVLNYIDYFCRGRGSLKWFRIPLTWPIRLQNFIAL